MRTYKLENRIIITNATNFETFVKEQKHNYKNIAADFRNSFMLRDWRKIEELNIMKDLYIGQKVQSKVSLAEGIINLIPYNVTIENDYPVYVDWQNGYCSWIKPSLLIRLCE